MPNGEPAAAVSVRFTLSNPSLLGVTVVVPTNVRATTDDTGQFSVALIPNSVHSYYTVTVYKSVGVVLLETLVVVPNNDCLFSQIIQTSQPTTITATAAATAQLLAAQVEIEEARLEVAGILAAVNASGGTGSANTTGFAGGTPTLIPSGSVFTVAENTQVLFTEEIHLDGDLNIDGWLTEIS